MNMQLRSIQSNQNLNCCCMQKKKKRSTETDQLHGIDTTSLKLLVRNKTKEHQLTSSSDCFLWVEEEKRH